MQTIMAIQTILHKTFHEQENMCACEKHPCVLH